jgi:hypothetical protein
VIAVGRKPLAIETRVDWGVLMRAIANALPLGAALSLTSCSWVLGWSGYSGGNTEEGGAPDRATEDGADADAAGPETGTAPDATPACGPKSCGGCCNSQGFCAGGESTASCGTGGEPCTDCANSGMVCSAGACATAVPQTDAAPPACDVQACQAMLRCPALVYEGACCLPDGTCGCQVQIPKPGPCM